jgi:hypothetical protein
MKSNLEETIRRVANFIDVELDEELFEITLKNSSYGFMKEHENQFDESLSRKYMEEHCGTPLGGNSTKVRTGKMDNHKEELPSDISQEMDSIWKNEISSKLGLDSYQALWDELKYSTVDN